MGLAQGDFSVFISRPISLSLLLIAAAMLVLIALPAFRSKRKEVFEES
jgi:putative tricarboxylic transport membrane protein